MNEPFPAFGSHFEEQQEISNSSQSKSDFLLDVGLSSRSEPVSDRRSGRLSPGGTKRYGMTDFGDLTVQDNLLEQFDPLSSQNVKFDEGTSTNAKPSITRLDSRENMELHRASGLILGRIKETNVENASVSSSGEATSDSFHTEPGGTCENDGSFKSCADNNGLDNAAIKKGKVSFISIKIIISR